jgi:DNA polymerase III subunit gamma/tau
LGQDHVVRTLKNAVIQHRLAHAYLFVGPRGTGKTSTARILAKSLNCIHGLTINPCGVCDSCREIAQGISLDVLEIDGASNNSVDQIRELRENVRFSPVRGRYKIYIIDEVHMLTQQAFNALLKTLEEPPEHVIFIFATTEPSRVPSTILSRCQRFDLRRIPAQTIARHLKYIADQEKIDLAADAAEAIAVAADGGLRDAESMLDQLVAFCGNAIDESQVLQVFGLTSEHVVINLVQAILTSESPAALGMVHEQSEAGKDMARLLSDLLGFLRNLLISKVDPGSLREDISEVMRTALETIRDRISVDQLLRMIEHFSAAEPSLRWASNKKLNLEIAIIRAIQSLREVGFDQVLEALEQLRDGTQAEPKSPTLPEKKEGLAFSQVEAKGSNPETNKKKARTDTTGGKATTSEEMVAEIASPTENVSVSLEMIWPRIRAQVAKHRPLIAGWIGQATPLSLDESVLLLGFPTGSGLALESLGRGDSRKFLNELVSELIGSAREVRFEIRTELEPPPHLPEPKEENSEHYRKEPLIQKALEIFDAEIEAPGERSNS